MKLVRPWSFGGAAVAHRGQLAVDCEALVRVTDGGREVGPPGEFAEALVQLPQAGNGARDAGGTRADRARIRNDVAGRVEIHVRRGAAWGALAVVEEVRFAPEVERGKAAATEIAGVRKRDGESEGHRHRRIRRVAPGVEDGGGGVGAKAVGGGDRRRRWRVGSRGALRRSAQTQ